MGATTMEERAVRADRGRLVPWVLWALTVAIAVAALLAAAASAAGWDLPDYINRASGLVWGSTAGLIGALIASSRRDNRIGWLLVATGLLVSCMMFAFAVSETNHPAADAFNILSDLGWVLFVTLFSLFILLFPDGLPLSPQWRPVIWFAGLWGPSLLVVGLIVAPQDFLSDSTTSVTRIVSGVLLFITFVAAGTSALLRFRRSSGTERQQLKWFAYGTAIGLAVTMAGSFLPGWGGAATALGLFGPLAGTAVALFRYRLYDIDELISRTFVYGALVAILAGVYTASIRLFNLLFENITGIGSEEALVITTLILATTFTPIKKRLEEIVEARYKVPAEQATDGGLPGAVGLDPAVEARLRVIVREELERAARAR